MKLLDAISRQALLPRHREHVTSFIWENAGSYKIDAVSCPEDWADEKTEVKLDVDLPSDLERLTTIFSGASFTWSVPEILSAWRAR